MKAWSEFITEIFNIYLNGIHFFIKKFHIYLLSYFASYVRKYNQTDILLLVRHFEEKCLVNKYWSALPFSRQLLIVQLFQIISAGGSVGSKVEVALLLKVLRLPKLWMQCYENSEISDSIFKAKLSMILNVMSLPFFPS